LHDGTRVGAFEDRLVQIEFLYQSHGPALLQYLRRAFGHCAPAEDLLHETFLAAMDAGDSCLQASSSRAYLFGIARHVGQTAARREKTRRTTPFPVVELAAETADPALVVMREAIGNLPEPLREALELRLRERLTYEEIAMVLAIPVGTVRSRLHTAVKVLRQKMDWRQ
jgi:RNA polymerase sigma factor (sigma-70 family)